MFAAILFDMDGTLVDTEPLWLRSESELMARYNYQWTVEDQAQCLGGPLDRVGEYMHRLAQGAQSGPYFTRELISLMEMKLHSGADLTEGAGELMSLCMQLEIPMALVSASPRVLVDGVLENLPPHGFMVSVSCDDVTRTKPDPEGYLKAAQFLHAPIEHCLVLEDSATGVAAAEASGACVIAIPHLVPIEESGRVKVLPSLKQLNLETLQLLYTQWQG
jgi:beta-phosphoglucomutase-like phosphatase (HAD superfamily)